MVTRGQGHDGNNDNATDGPLVEVANKADLSALTAVKFLAVGY